MGDRIILHDSEFVLMCIENEELIIEYLFQRKLDYQEQIEKIHIPDISSIVYSNDRYLGNSLSFYDSGGKSLNSDYDWYSDDGYVPFFSSYDNEKVYTTIDDFIKILVTKFGFPQPIDQKISYEHKRYQIWFKKTSD
jgi:hypothetical protein